MDRTEDEETRARMRPQVLAECDIAARAYLEARGNKGDAVEAEAAELAWAAEGARFNLTGRVPGSIPG